MRLVRHVERHAGARPSRQHTGTLVLYSCDQPELIWDGEQQKWLDFSEYTASDLSPIFRSVPPRLLHRLPLQRDAQHLAYPAVPELSHNEVEHVYGVWNGGGGKGE